MSAVMETIEKLAANCGHISNPHDRSMVAILENEIADLTNEIAILKDSAKICEELSEEEELALKVDMDNDEQFIDGLPVQMQKAQEKMDILRQYIATIETSDDFPINRLNKQGLQWTLEFKSQLKGIFETTMSVKEQLGKLREIQDKCDELRQQLN